MRATPGHARRAPLVLAHARMDAHGREIALLEQPIQLVRAGHLGHKDDDLVEVQRVEEIVELAILLGFLQFDVVL